MFVATKTISGGVYDAGTDNGVTFTSANSVSNSKDKNQNYYTTTAWKRHKS